MKRKDKLLRNYSGNKNTKLAFVVLEFETGSKIQKSLKPYQLFVVPSQARVFDLLSEIKKMMRISESQSVYLIGNDLILNPTSQL